MLFRCSVGTYQRNELTKNSSGNTRPQLSQLAEPLWTDLGLKSGTGARELIFIWKKKKKNADGEWFVEPLLRVLASEKEKKIMTTVNNDGNIGQPLHTDECPEQHRQRLNNIVDAESQTVYTIYSVVEAI